MAERELTLGKEIKASDLEIVSKSEENSANCFTAKSSDLNTAGSYAQRTSQRTPTDINVVMMNLPDNSSEISISSWKNYEEHD